MSFEDVHTLHLFEDLDLLLIDHLSALSEEEWHSETVSPLWTVKDIAAHLLDGNLRTLSMLRDGFYSESPKDGRSYEGMVAFLNRLNLEWVIATNRLSPKVIIDLLRSSGKEYRSFIKSLELYDKAVFAVEWMGEGETLNWMHIAREYTEKWHHTQQILEGTSLNSVLLQNRFLEPYLSTSMLALPFHYRSLEASEGESLTIEIHGDDFISVWIIQKSEQSWKFTDRVENTDSKIQIPSNVIWKIFSKEMVLKSALEQVEIEGEQKLALHLLKMIAVMA